MTQVVLINGEEQSKVSIFNRNMQYGDGLFETCIAKDNRILFWPNHLARLNKVCEKLNIKKIDESYWMSDLKKAFALYEHNNCIVKLILSRGESLRGYGYKEDITPVRVVIISEMKKKDFWVIGIENSIEAKQWHKMDYKGKIAIVLGSEGKGIRPLVKRSCDFLATIPMRGEISSLNVSAALSAIIFERQRQLQSSK